MTPDEVKALLLAHLQDCEIEVEGQGNHFQVCAVGDVFEGLNPVKRQQMIYAALNEKIADQTIHAVTIKTYTSAESAAR
jgi:acid stress-induced BolA-like protein IbaG/YrbA